MDHWTCSSSAHSEGRLTSFKWVILLAIPLLSHTSTLLWLRMVFCWATSFYSLSSITPESILSDPGIVFVCSECLAISLDTQQISSFFSLIWWFWSLDLDPRYHFPWAWRPSVPASMQTETFETPLCFLGCWVAFSMILVSKAFALLNTLKCNTVL